MSNVGLLLAGVKLMVLGMGMVFVFLVLMTLSKLLPRVYDFFSGIIEAIRSLVSSTGHSARRLADDFGLLR